MKLRNYEELWTTMNYELLSKKCDSYEQTTIHTCQSPEVVHSKRRVTHKWPAGR